MISEEILRFIRSSIKTVWALELLLLIRRQSSQSWTAEGLTTELRSSLPLVADILSGFKDAGLVKEMADGQYRYQPATPELEHLVEQLEKAYAARPLAVVKAILTAPNEKIQTFADAFKLKKD